MSTGFQSAFKALGANLGTDLAILPSIVRPSVKVLVISGRAGLTGTLHVKDQQFPCLGKPFTRLQLQQRITDILERLGLRQAR
jgi:hypothetical protein